jgi:opacity protein-like surface antigen
MHALLLSLLAAALLALHAAVPEARADGVRAEITPFAGYRMGGGFDAETRQGTDSQSVDVEDAGSWGIDVGIYATPDTFYEFLYATQTTGLDSKDPVLAGVDVTTEYFQFGGTAFFPGEQWPVPYLSMTIGATRFSADQGYGSDTKFSGSLGGGLRLPFTDNLAATLGVRGYLTFVESDTSFFCVSDSEEAGCLVRSSGSTFFQAEATLGLTVRF